MQVFSSHTPISAMIVNQPQGCQLAILVIRVISAAPGTYMYDAGSGLVLNSGTNSMRAYWQPHRDLGLGSFFHLRCDIKTFLETLLRRLLKIFQFFTRTGQSFTFSLVRPAENLEFQNVAVFVFGGIIRVHPPLAHPRRVFSRHSCRHTQLFNFCATL